MCVRGKERERERAATQPRSHAVCGGGGDGIKRFLLRADELCVAALAAFGGGHYKELIVGKSSSSASFVSTNPRSLDCSLTQNKHNAVLSSQSSKAGSPSAARCCVFTSPSLVDRRAVEFTRCLSSCSFLLYLSLFPAVVADRRPRFPRQLWRVAVAVPSPRLLLLRVRRRLNPSCARSGGQTLPATQ